MALYQLTDNPATIYRRDQRATIPEGHRLWDEYQAWLAAGNTPDPYVPVSFP